MDKLKMAHDFSMKLVGNPTTPLKSMESIVDVSWKYADAMQAEADERINKERPDVLCGVDWRIAPKNAFQWQMIDDQAYWRIEIMGGLDTELAPSFGFTGTHIVERPNGF